ncbi:MAG: hypothetical protein ACKV2T_41900 [Kofleriaceae bacterium]
MRLAVVAPIIALVAFGGARIARTAANERSGTRVNVAPYAPSPASAPIVTLGFRELAADVFFVRMLGYFGNGNTDASAVADLAEAIATLDPTFRRNYDVGAIAMSAATHAVGNEVHLRAIALLDKAATQFPTMWRYPNIAGQIYLVDLQTNDPVQRRAWDERGALLLESAARKPKAPANLGLQAAVLQSRYGQQQRAIQNLRELILITEDPESRKELVDKLAALAKDDGGEVAAELTLQRRAFDREWAAQRNSVPSTFYILIGPQLGEAFDLPTLATGGSDLIGTVPFERLEPLTDPPPTLEVGPSSP